MVIFYKKWKKYDEIKLTKKMDLNNLKMTNHQPSPVATSISATSIGRPNFNKKVQLQYGTTSIRKRNFNKAQLQ